MDYAYTPFRRAQYRNPSPFFSPATSVRQNPSPFFSPTTSDRQRPHPAEPAFPRRRGVVSIPVVDVNEDRGPQSVKVPRATGAVAVALSKHAAAVRIQSAFRGRVVRKALAAVRALDVEVRNIEARVRESIGRIATDERERLVVGELVMRVLLRLDGVRGVRDYRKKVVRRAVKLQEMIDSLASGGDGEEASSDEEEEGERPCGAEVVGGEEDVPVGNACNSLEGAATVLNKEAGYTTVGGGEGPGTGAVGIQEAGVVEESKNRQNGPPPTGVASRKCNADGYTGEIEVNHAMEEESTSKPSVTEENPIANVTADNHVMEEGSVVMPDAKVEAAEDHAMEGRSVSKPDAMEATSAATMLTGDRGDALMDDDASSLDLRGDDAKTAIEPYVENAPDQDEGALSDYVVVENAVSPLTEDSRQNTQVTTPSSEGSPVPVPLEMAPPVLSEIPSETPVPVPGHVETAVGRMTQESERLVGLVEELLQRSELQCRLVCQLTRRVESLEKKVEKMGKKKRKHAGDAGAIAAADKKN